MKRKFSLLINIATLVLCVSAIAIGVYSAKTASLNVSGTVGFTAHNCVVKVDSSLSGFSETLDGEVVSTARTNSVTVDGTATLDLGTFYFTDLTATGDTNDITLSLTFTNQSDFKVDVSIEAKDLSGSDITVTLDKTSLTLAEQTATEGTTGTVIVTLKCTSIAKIDSREFEILSVNMEKHTATSNTKAGVTVKMFTEPEQDNIKNGLGSAGGFSYSDTILCYAERFPYYVEMGTEASTGTKLKWLIVGAMDESDNISALTTTDTDAFALGKMLNKNYCLLSEKILYTESSSTYGISFQNAYTNSSPYLNTKYGVKVNDYATSNIREYLKGNTVQRASSYDSSTKTFSPSGPSINFLTTYNLTDDPLYSQIQETARDLDSLYKKMSDSGKDITKPTSNTSTAVDTTADKFWLLSQTEMDTIFKADKSSNYYMSARTSVMGETSAADWWLRSPYSTFAFYARHVSCDGRLVSGSVDSDYGVRAAFKI